MQTLCCQEAVPSSQFPNVTPLLSAPPQPGTGRRIGENCEQAWSQAKEWASPARFMSEVNYNDFNEDQYSMLTMGKARKFTKQLIETAKLNAKKTSGLQRQRWAHVLMPSEAAACPTPTQQHAIPCQAARTLKRALTPAPNQRRIGAAAASMEAVIKLAEAGGISKEEILEAVRNLVDPPQPEPEDDMTVRARQMVRRVACRCMRLHGDGCATLHAKRLALCLPLWP